MVVRDHMLICSNLNAHVKLEKQAIKTYISTKKMYK
jgi:hypothetical protein